MPPSRTYKVELKLEGIIICIILFIDWLYLGAGPTVSNKGKEGWLFFTPTSTLRLIQKKKPFKHT